MDVSCPPPPLFQDETAFAQLAARVHTGRHRELTDQELARLEANKTMLTPSVRWAPLACVDA